jgi:hypothetical protein
VALFVVTNVSEECTDSGHNPDTGVVTPCSLCKWLPLLWRNISPSSSEQSHEDGSDNDDVMGFAPCRLVGRCQRFSKTQNNIIIIIIIILIAVKTSNLTWK